MSTTQFQELIRAVISTQPAPSTPAPVETPEVVRRSSRPVIEKAPCSYPGCGIPSYAKGLCTKHYHRQLRNRPQDLPDRIHNAVQVGTTVAADVYQVLADAAKKAEVSPFAAARWIITKWAAQERVLAAKGERSRFEVET